MVSYLGADSGGQWYKAWGEARLQTGTIPIKYQYTGQYNQVIIGLYYYGARWYDTTLSRWTQPDSLIPEATQGVQAWDRYAYVNNNPVKFFDPSSHGVDCGLTDPNCKGGVPTDSLPNTEISIDSDGAHLEPVCKVLNQLTGETTFKYPANGPIPSDSYENDPNGNPIKCVSKDCVVPLLVMGLEALLVNFAPPQEYTVVASVQYEVDGVDVVYYLVTIDNSSKTNIGMVALNVETLVNTDPVLVTTTNSFNISGEVPAGQFGSSGIFNAQLSATSVENVEFVGFTIFENITIIFEIPLY